MKDAFHETRLALAAIVLATACASPIHSGCGQANSRNAVLNSRQRSQRPSSPTISGRGPTGPGHDSEVLCPEFAELGRKLLYEKRPYAFTALMPRSLYRRPCTRAAKVSNRCNSSAAKLTSAAAKLLSRFASFVVPGMATM